MNKSPPASRVYISAMKLILVSYTVSPSGWISFISCTLMMEKISGIYLSLKYLYSGIAYNKQTLLKSRENRYLLQWKRVERLSLSFLLCSMSLSCAAGGHNSTILAFLHVSQCKMARISFSCWLTLYSSAFLSPSLLLVLILILQT